MANISCPHCHQQVDSQALVCPYCRTTLKAYGHPGITLHRAGKNTYLCDTCTYHADDTCTFPKRPYAKDCTLYQNIDERNAQLEEQRTANSFGASIKNWIKRNQSLILLLGLLLICLFIALSTN
ncbi:zinc ribbon domain-containing protein [Anabaena subtropica]|uniref:Zinc ribbon domain-containing protein n=1 Tax=Anabaena subtropica FACHB-260 TaxID=2692884 RepID=A0ABR8CMD8_9NOST|nr:zinc ribbon domain-containing protein [Anabaena subtropica]MBD2344402.1 zinc ribbon domain-containing protein [Anabaena subtropica FACHB-260]